MTVVKPLIDTLESHPAEHVAVIDTQGLSLSFGLLSSHIRELTQWLDEYRLGGVAVALDNGPTAIISDIALLTSKHWCLPIPPFFTPKQVSHALCDSGCAYLLTECRKPGNLIGTKTIAGLELHLYQLPQLSEVVLPTGTKKITYTSGSTGDPKGLCLSGQHILDRVDVVVEQLEFSTPFRHLSLLPWSVLLENVAGIYACLRMGATCIVPPLSSCTSGAMCYNFDRVGQWVRQLQPDSTILVPELLRQYLNHLEREPECGLSWHYVAVGGATVPASLLEQSAKLGVPVYEGYGLSEAASVVSLNKPGSVCAGSVGKLLPGVGMSLAEDGELLLEQASFLGVTGSLIPPRQPFPTGDIGTVSDDGFLFVEGRKKTVIITGMGRNVAPEWIESEFLAVCGISQVFVYADHEQRISMLVACHDQCENLESDINNAMLGLPEYAKIHGWRVVDEFTVENGLLTGNGKLNRPKLQAFAAQLDKQSYRNHADYSRR